MYIHIKKLKKIKKNIIKKLIILLKVSPISQKNWKSKSLTQPLYKIPRSRHNRSAKMSSECDNITAPYPINFNVRPILCIYNDNLLTGIGSDLISVVDSYTKAMSGRWMIKCICDRYIPLDSCQTRRCCGSPLSMSWALISEEIIGCFNVRCTCGNIWAELSHMAVPVFAPIRGIPTQILCACGTISNSYPCGSCDQVRLTECAFCAPNLDPFGDTPCLDLIDLHKFPHRPLCMDCYKCSMCSEPFEYTYASPDDKLPGWIRCKCTCRVRELFFVQRTVDKLFGKQ